MKYRVTVEEVVEPTEDNKYPTYPEVYQQIVPMLDVHDLATYINEPLRHRLLVPGPVPKD